MIIRHALPLLLALWTAGPTADPAAVQEVRISAAGDETEIAVLAGEDVGVRDFLLDDPARLVLDLEGASHALPRNVFEGIGRGGVVQLRTSQFRDGVVRLVFELEARSTYRVVREGEWIYVRLPNAGGSFVPWSAGGTDAGEAPGATASGPDRGGSATSSVEEPTGENGSESSTPVQELTSQQPRISVTYDSASMLDVLAGFSEFSGMSIVPGEEVAGRSVRGVEIHDQSWDVALDAILTSQGLGWQRTESGILLVDDLATLRGRDTLQSETRVLRINYAGADSVAQALQRLATPERGQVVSYQGTNSVIVTDAPSVVSRMDSLVRVLDRPTPQVSIEAKIIFVDRTNVNQLGLVYDLRDKTGPRIPEIVPGGPPGGETSGGESGSETQEVDITGPSIASIANANDRVTSPALQILASTAFGSFSLTSFIEALQTHQLSDVQAAPSIQVVDNHQARIQVGERTPIRVLESGAQLEQAQVSVQFEDTGIILEATPHITNNNQILLDLSAERSGLGEATADVGLIFDRQQGETRLLLGDGETAVIGGLTLSEVSRAESGIPLLMDLPLVGSLFRTTRESETKQDLIILVTPHIVEVPGSSSSSE
jgi:type IV pilus assembly protein PilQ